MGKCTVFVSTGGFRTSPATAIETLIAAGIDHIELSGGLPSSDALHSVGKYRQQATMQPHNYFPAVSPPFVFNLASSDAGIRGRTLQCMSNAVDLAKDLGATRYSVHAGFLLDPPVRFLGEPWQSLPQVTLDQGVTTFVDSIAVLANYAAIRGIELLVENNVLTTGTLDACGPDVLLMASGDQIMEVMDLLPDDVGLLMDVAHLNVTARSLGLDARDVLDASAARTRGYHLSDNDGTADTNQALSQTSWFWPHLASDVPFATLELIPMAGDELVEQVNLTTRMWKAGVTG